MILVKGRIGFDPPSKTKKQIGQDSWKRIAMVYLEGDLTEYYSWFIQNRYGIKLNKPMRGPHISFINDSLRDLTKDFTLDTDLVEENWNRVKEKWDGRIILISLDLDVRTDGRTWWLNIPQEDRLALQEIRNELGLGRPYFGMHMSIGYANEREIIQSQYIHELIKEGNKNYE